MKDNPRKRRRNHENKTGHFLFYSDSTDGVSGLRHGQQLDCQQFYQQYIEQYIEQHGDSGR
jgi:hypothetical protein